MLLFFHILQFNNIKHQGTKIILYNLWEDDEGQLELDFDIDPYVGVTFFMVMDLSLFLILALWDSF